MTGVVRDRYATDRACAWCREGLPETLRADAKFCSKRCRQASHRFGRGCVARGRAERPLRLAYADPPYPGLARRYYAERPEYEGEVDHAALLSSLATYDGWALSTSARALPRVLKLCVAQDLRDVRVAAWFRGARRTRSHWPLSSWEPVVYAGGRQVSSDTGATRRIDALVHVARARTTDPLRVVGSKPAKFCWWLFELLGALPGDTFDDLFPGSGRVLRAWELYVSRGTSDATPVALSSSDASRSPADATAVALRGRDMSPEYSRDTSLRAPDDACTAVQRDTSPPGALDASREARARRLQRSAA